MPNFLASKKLAILRRTGPDLVLNSANTPWLVNVLKITGLTTPSGSGSNSRTSYTGAFGGLTPGGTLASLRQGQNYEMNLGKFDGSFNLPDLVEVTTPTISSLNPLSVTAGDALNITGTNLQWVKHVFVGGALAAVTAAATTNTNVAVTVPLGAAVGANAPLLLVTETGSALVTTLTVTSSGTQPGKLAKPVLNQPSNITANGFTISWATVPGADGYRVRLNSSTLYMPGNVTTYTFTNLPTGALATVDVQALDSTGAKQTSDYSNSVAATPSANTGPVPTITSFTPMGGVPGNTFVITGTNFTGATLVSVNNATVANYNVDSATQITATLTTSNMSGLVRVTTPNGTAVSAAAFVVVPPDRRYTVAVSNDTYTLGKNALDRVYIASTSPFISADGTTFNSISPGGPQSGYFKRVWMRDWAMAIIAYLDFATADNIRRTLELFRLAKDTRPGFENEIPDRIFNDGSNGGLIERVPFPNQVHSVCDNQFFFIQGVYSHALKIGAPDYYVQYKAEIDAIFEAVTLQNGCVYIATQNVGDFVFRTGFGFNDSIYLSGKLTYATALRYRAARQLAQLNLDAGNAAEAQRYVTLANDLQDYFNDPANGLWDSNVGLFRVASEIGVNIYDVWANALAVETGLANAANSLLIAQALYARRAEWLYHGAVRHVMSGNEDRPGVACWPRYVTGNGRITTDPTQAGSQPGYNNYQDGGHWMTPAREMRSTMALVNARFAQAMVVEGLRYNNFPDSSAGYPDNAEWYNEAGGFTNPQYAATAAGAMGLVVSGGADASPSASYQFEQASGNFLDSSGNDLQLARFGSPLVGTTTGATGLAAAFDATKGQYLRAVSTFEHFDYLAYRGGLGIKLNVKLTLNGQDQVIFAKGSAGKLSYKVFYQASNNAIVFAVSADGASYVSNTNAAYPSGGFSSIGVGFDGKFLALLFDGAVVSAQSYQGGIYTDTTTPFLVGTDPGTPGTSNLNGTVDNLKVYRYQLTVNEFAA